MTRQRLETRHVRRPALAALVLTLIVTSCTPSPRAAEGPVPSEDVQAPSDPQVTSSSVAPTPHPADDVDLALELVLIDPMTGDVQRIASLAGDLREPELSRDGSQLAFQSGGVFGSAAGMPQIEVLSSEGRRRLTHLRGGALEPTWSPDGTQIAFVARRDETSRDTDIFVMNADGSNQRRLVGTPRDDRRPDWSPDGARLVFDAGASIYVFDLEDRDLTLVTSYVSRSQGPPVDPTWSPDGEWIAITRFDPGTINNVNPQAHLWVIGADGSKERPLERSREGWMDWQLEPTWSPDGTSIAFIDHPTSETHDVASTGSLRTRIGIVDVRTRAIRYIRTSQPVADLSWAADGIVATTGESLTENPYFVGEQWFW